MNAIAKSSSDESVLEEAVELSPAIRIQLPAERAEFFFVRAKRLYQLGGKHSVILERVVTTTLKVAPFRTANFCLNVDFYMNNTMNKCF